MLTGFQVEGILLLVIAAVIIIGISVCQTVTSLDARDRRARVAGGRESSVVLVIDVEPTLLPSCLIILEPTKGQCLSQCMGLRVSHQM